MTDAAPDAVSAPAAAPAADRADGRAERPRVRAVLLHGDTGAAPAWGARAGAEAVAVPAHADGPEPVPAVLVADALAGAGCVLLDAGTLDPLPVARWAHQADPDVQVVVVVGTEERRRALERAILFAPGVGELWLASPTEVAGALAERAAGVTAQRRRYRRTRERLERDRVAHSPQRAERALISDAYLADLLQVLPEAVFSVDAAGRILSANPAAARLFSGPERPELTGLRLDDLLARAGSSAAALVAASAAAPVSAAVDFRHPDGSPGHGELRVARVAGAESPLFAAVLHDLTEWQLAQQQLEDQAAELETQAVALEHQAVELEQANDELLRQRDELEAALGARSRFYAAMSHELRTPINAVIGYTGLALEGVYGPLADELHDALARARRAATHLHELVNDVLDLAKVEAGRIELALEPVDMAALADDILHSVRPTAEQSGTPVSLACSTSGASPLVTDPRRVRQILLNLLSNALKFGAGRPVTLRCAEVPGGVALSVTDRGRGIPAEEQSRVFEEFVQLDPDRHRGTGLGLPISRRLAELLGGTLTVESAPGAGSTFTLTLRREAGGEG